uniref:F-box domain-containing protein n=1 Tax=Haptolina brevifila TaxID=156173 RepID=A0A7S2IZ27_9EUKA|mmetsp:Transcript_7398/g.15080  ORF Transcript_7398/g.15080 Transcript_7398/m.15080 type:complete len:504 (+) Transcript_7398:97-1608(+)
MQSLSSNRTVLVALSSGAVFRVAAPAPSNVAPSLGPDELLHVLRHWSIPECARVASTSSEVAMAVKARVAEATSLDVQHLACDDERLKSLLAKMPVLESLSISDGTDLTADGLVAAVLAAGQHHGWRRLAQLNLASSPIDAAGFYALWAQLPHLTGVSLDGCDAVQEVDMCVFAEAPAGSISSLSLAHCPGLSSSGCLTVLCRYGGTHLTNLNASGYNISEATLSSIGVECPHLRNLKLSECDFSGDEAISLLFSRCTQLQRVDLSWCEGTLSTSSVTTLMSHCPELTHLELRCCSNIEAARVCALLGACSLDHLRLLNLNRCNHDVLPALIASESSPSSSAGGQSSLQRQLLAPLAACASLTWLDLGWLADMVDDASCAMILTSLPNLLVLSLEGCKALTNAALSPLWADGEEEPLMATGMLRLNCAWADLISTECLQSTLRAADARDRRRTGGTSKLQVLDYYGNCWGCGPNGRPVRCKLEQEKGLEMPLIGWVASWDHDD